MGLFVRLYFRMFILSTVVVMQQDFSSFLLPRGASRQDFWDAIAISQTFKENLAIVISPGNFPMFIYYIFLSQKSFKKGKT